MIKDKEDWEPCLISGVKNYAFIPVKTALRNPNVPLVCSNMPMRRRFLKGCNFESATP